MPKLTPKICLVIEMFSTYLPTYLGSYFSGFQVNLVHYCLFSSPFVWLYSYLSTYMNKDTSKVVAMVLLISRMAVLAERIKYCFKIELNKCRFTLLSWNEMIVIHFI